MLTKNQFDVLDCIITSENKLSQRNIAKQTKLSVGTVNKTLLELDNLGYIKNNEIDLRGICEVWDFDGKNCIKYKDLK